MTVSTDINTPTELYNFINNNASKPTIVKFGATWCGPCKKIEPLVERFYKQHHHTFNWVFVDIDIAIELFSFFKKRRIANGIPAIMRFKAPATGTPPDDIVVGAHEAEFNQFFVRSLQAARL
jgi:thiol-disulfide isomerase/thioredoxin